MAIPFTDFEDQFNRAVLQNISFRIFISQSVIIFFDDICALFHVLIYFQCYQIKPYENFSNKILISVWLCCCYVPLYKSASFKKFSSPVGNYMLKCNNRNTRTSWAQILQIGHLLKVGIECPYRFYYYYYIPRLLTWTSKFYQADIELGVNFFLTFFAGFCIPSDVDYLFKNYVLS